MSDENKKSEKSKSKTTLKITTNDPALKDVAQAVEDSWNAGELSGMEPMPPLRSAGAVGEVVDDLALDAAVEPSDNVATKTSDAMSFDANKDWMTNPAPLDTDDDLKNKDDAKLAGLRKDRREVVFRARERLRDPGAITLFSGVLDAQKFSTPALAFKYEREKITLTGKLTIAFTPRMAQLDSLALARYLNEYSAFSGSPAEIVDQICHDLFVLGKPSKVKVSFSTSLHGLNVGADATHEW